MPKNKILIVEDELSLRKALVDYLSKQDYVTVTAMNGVEAVDKFKSESPDLVVLDLIMPQKNGFDVLEEIRVNLKSNVPVIIVSNLEREQDIDTAKNLGATDYVLKSDTSLRTIAFKISKALSIQAAIRPAVG